MDQNEEELPIAGQNRNLDNQNRIYLREDHYHFSVPKWICWIFVGCGVIIFGLIIFILVRRI